MNPLERRVLDAIDMEGLLGFLSRLIAVPSLGGHESSAQDLVAGQMARSGLEVDRWEIDLAELRRHPMFSEEIERTEGLGVVGRCGADNDARSLILNGHTDVVPVGEPDRWRYPPWQATLTDRHVYGRGSADMKGGLCCALFAAKAIRDAGVELASPLLLQSVIGEEDGGTGTLATLERGHRASAAIILEPTDLEIVIAQAGALNFRLTIAGLAAHGSMRTEGVSALEKFLPLHSALRGLEETRNSASAHPLLAEYDLPYPISIGTLRTGTWASTVPDELTCEGRFGVALGEKPEAARQVLESAIAAAAREDPWLRRHPPQVHWWGGQFAPAETATDHPVIHTVGGAMQDLTTRRPRVKGVTYGADMRLLVNQGRIPTIMFGPGDVRQAHQVDEYVPIDDLYLAVRALTLVVLRYCGYCG